MSCAGPTLLQLDLDLSFSRLIQWKVRWQYEKGLDISYKGEEEMTTKAEEGCPKT